METHALPALEKSRRNINEIIVHCTATPAGRAVKASDIDRWHRERGFDCIGYHYVVTDSGKIETGRHPDRTGAHCLGHNACSIGVVYTGGLDARGHSADTRTPAQREALVNLLKELKKLYPQAKIYGHRDFAAKDCPCFDATTEYAAI